MKHAAYVDIVSQATYILSVVPPEEALAIAQLVVDAVKDSKLPPEKKLIFVDFNAINPQTAKQTAQLFDGTCVTFVDGSIVGGPPSDMFNPGLYICADSKDEANLDDLDAVLKRYGLRPFPLKGEGSGIGDASAVKMANSGIVKGAIALFTAMILASHASSPSTSQGLLHSLLLSQPTFIDQMIRLVPQMTPKAYRFIGEMREVSEFTEDEGSTRIYEGAAQLFERIAKAKEEETSGDGGDIDVLLTVIEEAKTLWAKDKGTTWAPPS